MDRGHARPRFHVKQDGPAASLIARAEALGVPVAPSVAGGLVALLDRIALERQNLTSIDGVPEGIERHLLDSLVGLRHPDIAAATEIIDVGSGAGFPGLVLAALRPEATVTLVESEGRKADWLRRASADLPNLRVMADRSEHVAAQHRESWPVATARAVGPPAVALELTAPLVAPGGAVVLWRGRPDPQAEASARRAAAQLGLRPGVELEVRPFRGAQRRLQGFRKVAPTPTRFPRRAGRAARRPL